jgi:hypothetical protein
MLDKNYDRKCLVEKIDGRESQVKWRQYELMDSKPPVVK